MGSFNLREKLHHTHGFCGSEVPWHFSSYIVANTALMQPTQATLLRGVIQQQSKSHPYIPPTINQGLKTDRLTVMVPLDYLYLLAIIMQILAIMYAGSFRFFLGNSYFKNLFTLMSVMGGQHGRWKCRYAKVRGKGPCMEKLCIIVLASMLFCLAFNSRYSIT